MAVVEFQILPIPKPRMTQRDKWKKRPIVERYYRYKDELNRQAKIAGFKLPDKYVIEFHLKIPEYWSKKRKNQLIGAPHQQKPDLDNLIKAFQDALECEDMQVYELKAKKLWSDTNLIIVRYGEHQDQEQQTLLFN